MKYYFYNTNGDIGIIYSVVPSKEVYTHFENRCIEVAQEPVFEERAGYSKELYVDVATRTIKCRYVALPTQTPTTEERLITLENALLKQQGVI